MVNYKIKQMITAIILILFGWMMINNFLFTQQLPNEKKVNQTLKKKHINVYLFRHGETLYNKLYRETGKDPKLPDTLLTKKGHNQTKNMNNKISKMKFDLILCSPMSRTLQTAHNALSKEQIKSIVINPYLTEPVGQILDLWKDPAYLKKYFPLINFEKLNNKSGIDFHEKMENHQSFSDRVGFVINQIKKLHVKNILIVGHQYFFSEMIKQLSGNDDPVYLKNANLFHIKI
jgi:broad specificity phosphatase PhoE